MQVLTIQKITSKNTINTKNNIGKVINEGSNVYFGI